MSRRCFETPCTVEIACDGESLHAHVLLDGVEIGPADKVRVHEGPTRVCFGERRTITTRATVTRANAMERAMTYLAARLQLTELFEVSFSPGALRPGALSHGGPR